MFKAYVTFNFINFIEWVEYSSNDLKPAPKQTSLSGS